MISTAEKCLLYWLTKHYCNGSGQVIDAGCFLGASTLALVAGLLENKSWPQSRKALAIDKFAIMPGMSRLYPMQLGTRNVGESFFDVFQSVTRPMEEMISAHPSDFLEWERLPSPIEVLFIDISKSNDLNKQIVRLGFPNLVEGHSIVVQQDYLHEFCPWIISTMEHFSERFEIIDHVSGDTFVFRFVGPAISPEEIEAFCQLSGDNMLALHLGAQARVERSLEVMGSGKIAVPLRHAILQIMYLSYVEMVRIEKGAEHAARLISEKVFENVGLDFMPPKINAMRTRVGAQPS